MTKPPSSKSIKSVPTAANVDEAKSMLTGSGDGKTPKPPRPKVPESVKKRTKKWWTDTNRVPDFDAAVKAASEAQKALFPARSDPRDPWRGKTPKELKRRKDDRRVNVALAYKAGLQSVAMSSPDEQSCRWKPKAQVEDDSPNQSIGPDPTLRRYARTHEILAGARLEEIGWQDTCEAWIQDATSAPLAILKVTYQREFFTDSIASGRENDKQDDYARYDALRDRFARGEFNQKDAEFQDLQNLTQELGESTELDYWFGLSVENIAIDSFRFDGNIRSLETVYSARWMSHDVMKTREEVREQFPYRPSPDAVGEATWTGIHPDDLDQATCYDVNGAVKGSDLRRQGKPQKVNAGDENYQSSKGKTGNEDMLLVREVWSKRDRRVSILVDGIDYPALEWVPKRTPQQFYPFILNVLNRVFGSVYGISDVELVKDIQDRMNRKWTDDENLRFGAMPRGIYNNAFDQQEAIKLEDIKPLQLKGINLGGAKTVKEVVEWFAAPYSEQWCETHSDEQAFQRMASQPPSFNGAVGESKFAAENDSAMQGLQVSSNFRQKRIRRSLVRFYTVVAEILAQEEGRDQVMDTCGSKAVWPTMYDDAEAKRMTDQLTKDAQIAVGQQMAPQVAAAASSGDSAAIQAAQLANDEAVKQKFAELSTKACGFPEPMTHEALFRRLRCEVKVSLNSPQEKQQRAAALLKVFSAMGEAAQVCMAAGIRFNPKPFLHQVAGWMDADADELDEMFSTDPNAMVVQLQSAIQKSPGALNPQAAQAIVMMAQTIASALQGGDAPAQSGQPAVQSAQQQPGMAAGAS
jgi:hypothetical protein